LDRWRRAEVISGSRGRLQVRWRNNQLVYASRLVWFWTHGGINDYEIDHRNNDFTDNRPDNLQVLSRFDNQRKAEADGLIKRGGSSPSRSRGALRHWLRSGRRELQSKKIREWWRRKKAAQS
jgi:hypothetical protein